MKKIVIILGLVLLANYSLSSITISEAAFKFAEIIYKYNALKDYNKTIQMEKLKLGKNINNDSLGRLKRLRSISVSIDSVYNFKEIKLDIETNSNLKYFEFIDHKHGFLEKNYKFAIDSNYNIYKLVNFEKSDLDLFYRYEFIKQYDNYKHFVRLFYDNKLYHRYIFFNGIDSLDKVGANFEKMKDIEIFDENNYLVVSGFYTILEPSSDYIHYELHKYIFKFYNDKFEDSSFIVREYKRKQEFKK